VLGNHKIRHKQNQDKVLHSVNLIRFADELTDYDEHFFYV